MRYCKVESYMHGTPPANWDNKYESPMIGDNTIYNMVPMDGSLRYLLEANPEGYDTYEDAYLAVSEAVMDILPNVSFGLPYLAPDAFQDTDFLAYLDPFFGQFNEYSWNYYYQPSPTIDASIGSIELTGGSRGTAAFMNYGTVHSPAGDNWYYMQPQPGSASPHFVWDYTVFPYDVFRTGKFDFSVMKDAVNFPGDTDRKRYCNVKFEIWDYEAEVGKPYRYQAVVYLYGYDQFIQNLNDYYQGKETTVYDSGAAIKKPTTKDDDGGSGTRKTDDIPIPELPGTDMTSAGGLRVYSLNPADIKSFFDYLHSHDPGESLIKWWQNPIQGVLSLHYLPYAIEYKGHKQGLAPTYESINVLGLTTGVSALVCDQWQEINFGYLDLDYESGSYLDMSPYTKVSIYLPGVGIREINTDDVMGRRIWVIYQCDNVTGQFVAYVAVGTKNTPKNKVSIRYAFSGQVAASFPLSQENWGNTYISGATLVAGALALGVAGAGAAGAAAAGEGGAGAFMSSEANTTALKGAASGIGKGAISNAGSAGSLLAKPTISRSGAVSGTTSLFAFKKPYLIIESPSYYDYDGEYAAVKGWKYGTYQPFSKLKGYAEIEACHLHDITATLSELNEIEALLSEGVVF